MNPSKKNLVIFDFDQTITHFDSLFEQFPLLKDEKESERLKAMDAVGNYVDTFNTFYELAHNKKISIEQINEVLKHLKLTKGMKELFDFLRNHKEKFEVIVISSNFAYAIEKVLEYNNMRDIVSMIYCNPYKMLPNGKIAVIQRDHHDCKDCNPCQCKSKELKIYLEENKREYYNNLYFIADGGNDLCLAKNLGKNDVVFPRKDFNLYKKVIQPEIKKILSCKVEPWSDAEEIINYLNK